MSESSSPSSPSNSAAAIPAARAAVASQREAVKEYPGKAPALVRALQVLGDAQREAGDIAAAEATYREALEAGAKLELPADAIANVRTSLATLLDFNGREADSVPYYEEAINNHEALGGENLEVAAQLRNNLAMTYKGLGKFALAEQHYLRALETLENKRGRSSESVACVYNNLAACITPPGFPIRRRRCLRTG